MLKPNIDHRIQQFVISEFYGLYLVLAFNLHLDVSIITHGFREENKVTGLSGLFAKKKPPLIGIDISSSAVKVLELSKSGEHLRVERYAVEPLPQNAVVEHAITEVEQVAQVVERAVKKSGTKVRHAAVAVPAAHVITKTIKMAASLSDQDRQTQVEMEADHYIPYPLNEINLDFQVLGPSGNNPEEVDVLMAACRKEIVDDYLAVIQRPGLTPMVVDVETYAMENAFSLITSHMPGRSEEHTSELQSQSNLVCRLLLEKKMVYDFTDFITSFLADMNRFLGPSFSS